MKIVLMFLFALSLMAQNRFGALDIFGTSGANIIRINGATGQITLLTGASIRTAGGVSIIDHSGNAVVNNFTVNGSVGSSFRPSTTATYDLGSSSFRWRDVHFSDRLLQGAFERIDTSGRGTFSAVRIDSTDRIVSPGFWNLFLSPSADGVYDLGENGFYTRRWRDLYLTNSIIMGTTTFVNSSRDVTARNLTLSGSVGSHLIPSSSATYDLGSTSFSWNRLYLSTSLWHNGTERINSFGTGKFASLDIGGTNRITTDGFWNLTLSPSSDGVYDLGEVGFYTRRWRDIRLQGSVIINGTARINSSGDVIANNLSFSGSGPYSGTGPVTVSGTTIACPNCVDLSSTQTVSGNKTLSGTNTLSGNMTVTGNLYLRTFAGTPSCSGVADGWVGIDTSGLKIWVCVGGVAKYASLF